MFKSPHYAELSEDTLAWILQSDRLQADEPEIYSAMREWGTVNMVVLEKPMADVIAHVVMYVRFPLLSTEQLAKIEVSWLSLLSSVGLGFATSASRILPRRQPDSPISTYCFDCTRAPADSHSSIPCWPVFPPRYASVRPCTDVILPRLLAFQAENDKEKNIPVALISKAWKYHATKKGDPDDPAFSKRAGTR